MILLLVLVLGRTTLGVGLNPTIRRFEFHRKGKSLSEGVCVSSARVHVKHGMPKVEAEADYCRL